MRIAVTAAGDTLESAVDPRFGRCRCFLIVETDDLAFEAVVNPNASRDSGAGIQAARLLAKADVQFVLTGNCGPNAYQTLAAAGIGVVVGCSGTASAVIEEYKAGGYSTAQEPNVASHFDVGAATVGSPSQDRPESGFAMGMGAGRGRGGVGAGMGQGGMGMGMGMGQGGGRGMGRGAGRGMGQGAGRGMGRGRMAGQPTGNLPPQPAASPHPEASQQLDALKAQAREVEAQLAALNDQVARIGQTPNSPRLVAAVDDQQCLGCGALYSILPGRRDHFERSGCH